MARREYYSRYPCAEPGCGERANFVHELRRDQIESDKFYAKNPWRCTRHTSPADVLASDNLSRSRVLVASKVRNGSYAREVANYERLMAGPSSAWAPYPPRKPDPEREFLPGLFWMGEGYSSGRISGPGFKAWADDFPEGTRLTITARIEVPDAPAGDTPEVA